MRSEFINEVCKIQGIKKEDLVEKDIILHLILTDLSKNKFFSENFIFKGGTCLIKYYLGYFRFSEDIDFTWKNQKIFEGKSQSNIRDYLSKIINNLGSIFEEISVKRGLDFKCEKNNINYIEFGGGNKICTFKIWYQSDILKTITFIKIQINFVEKLCFTIQKAELVSLLSNEQEELEFLFPEYKEYLQKIIFYVYDIHEILSEKVRSILTRKGFKMRDFLDIYLICKKFNIRLEEVHKSIISKTKFILGLYEKYRNNLENKKNLIASIETFKWGEERGLLLQDIDEKEFYKFLKYLITFLNKILDKLT